MFTFGLLVLSVTGVLSVAAENEVLNYTISEVNRFLSSKELNFWKRESGFGGELVGLRFMSSLGDFATAEPCADSHNSVALSGTSNDRTVSYVLQTCLTFGRFELSYDTTIELLSAELDFGMKVTDPKLRGSVSALVTVYPDDSTCTATWISADIHSWGDFQISVHPGNRFLGLFDSLLVYLFKGTISSYIANWKSAIPQLLQRFPPPTEFGKDVCPYFLKLANARKYH